MSEDARRQAAAQEQIAAWRLQDRHRGWNLAEHLPQARLGRRRHRGRSSQPGCRPQHRGARRQIEQEMGLPAAERRPGGEIGPRKKKLDPDARQQGGHDRGPHARQRAGQHDGRQRHDQLRGPGFNRLDRRPDDQRPKGAADRDADMRGDRSRGRPLRQRQRPPGAAIDGVLHNPVHTAVTSRYHS